MCGITGLVDFKNNVGEQPHVIQNMNLGHINRGPDAEGIWLSKHAALGHRRLIIIDPEGGTQPMVKHKNEKTYTIVYNGELYNMNELREKLLAAGWQFESRSDTELILSGYIEWGEKIVDILDGIFAFAIWDEAQQQIFIARDRLGVKPLFYSRKDSLLIFGSELKSLLAHPDISARLDNIGVSEILLLGPARTPGIGVFRDLLELKPGHWLKFNRESLEIRQYWQLQSHEHPDSFDETVEKVRELFFKAVEKQLVSDVPLGCMLSGGLDSSAISAHTAGLFKSLNKGPVSTFSVDYKDNSRFFKENEFQPNADAPWAKLVADTIASQHNVIELDNDSLIEGILPAMRARDLPGMTDVDASLLLFCKEIKKVCTVVLSGECADEVFGGYPWFHREDMINAQTFPWARLTQQRLNFVAPDLISNEEANSYINNRYQEALDEVPRLNSDTATESRMREMFYLSLTRWMPTLLDRKDRMSMAAGLEVRVPFCDHHLIEYTWNIPWNFKNHNQREKGLLRHTLKDILPEAIIERKKSPYPKTHNPKYLESMTKNAREILLDKEQPLFKLISYNAAENFLNQDLTKINLPWFGQLMNVPALLAYWFQLNNWLREYKVAIH